VGFFCLVIYWDEVDQMYSGNSEIIQNFVGQILGDLLVFVFERHIDLLL
jgi:hypothetical protein